MTHPISSDNFPAHPAIREQKPGAGAADRHSQGAPEATTGPQGNHPDVDRAHQRLSQETEGTREPAIGSADGARREIASIKALLTANPQTGLAAHSRVNGKLFEAAMARPTA